MSSSQELEIAMKQVSVKDVYGRFDVSVIIKLLVEESSVLDSMPLAIGSWPLSFRDRPSFTIGHFLISPHKRASPLRLL